jgi:PAS domain S-box-containing protein
MAPLDEDPLLDDPPSFSGGPSSERPREASPARHRARDGTLAGRSISTRTPAFLDSLTPEQVIERLTLALDGAGVGVWDWDLRTNEVQFDRRWCEMLGLDPATTPMVLSTWESRVHPDDLAQCYADIGEHVAGRRSHYENVHRMRHANGHWIHILDRGRISARDAAGRPMRFTGTHLDVTATERAKQALQDQERQLKMMVQNLPVSVAMLDRELRYLAVSERWLAAHGLARADVLGARASALFPSTFARWSPVYERGLAGETLGEGEEHFEGEEGLRWAVCPWRTFEQDVGGVIVVTEDVSDEVVRRTAREHESRLAQLGVMAAGIGHEINTPLQIVVLECESMAEELAAEPPRREEIAASVEVVHRTALKISEIVRSMRALARDSTADPTARVEVASVARSLVALCESRMATLGIRFERDLGEPDLAVLGREAEVTQVLLNLLNNAIDAVTGQPERWIRLTVTRSGDVVSFRCADSGPGVPPADAHRLMQPFFTTKPTGTGLGLSISRAVAARMRGSLGHEPGEAHTTFTLAMPHALPTGRHR